MSNGKIVNVGISDEKVTKFENQFKVNGMAYNSYAVKDGAVAVFDTVDKKYGDIWIENIKKAVGNPDYLFITHVEPDHSSNILRFLSEFENAKIVANAKAFSMIKNFYGTDFSDRWIEVKDGESFLLGNTELTFISAPMVHWPEVQTIYDKTDKILFSADAFGRFGAEKSANAIEEARRYYFGIVGKYGAQVQALLKKVAPLEINAIYPLHGGILTGKDMAEFIRLYGVWSSYAAEEDGVALFYTTVYGNTEKAVLYLKERLEKSRVKTAVYDLTDCDMYDALAGAFRYGKAVFASTTYNADVFPVMRDFLTRLAERNFKNRRIGLVENGSWAATAAKVMREILSPCKDLTFCETAVKITSCPTEENKTELYRLAEELIKE